MSAAMNNFPPAACSVAPPSPPRNGNTHIFHLFPLLSYLGVWLWERERERERKGGRKRGERGGGGRSSCNYHKSFRFWATRYPFLPPLFPLSLSSFLLLLLPFGHRCESCWDGCCSLLSLSLSPMLFAFQEERTHTHIHKLLPSLPLSPLYPLSPAPYPDCQALTNIRLMQ